MNRAVAGRAVGAPLTVLSLWPGIGDRGAFQSNRG